MNFELKTMDVAQAASEKCDLLVLLVPEGFAPGKDALGAVVAQAFKAKDLDTKPGKSLQLYQAAGIAARRVVLAGVGAGDARAVRQALAALSPALKQGAPKRAVVCLAGGGGAAAVAAGGRGVAQASYVYTATKPKAEARTLVRVVVGVHDARALSAPFERAVAVSLVNAALAAGWGAAWLTGWPAYDRVLLEGPLGLGPDEWLAGFVYIGSCGTVPPERPRPDMAAIVTWVDG